ncbi:recombinase family protein [Streptomyces lasiicapitis]|uniref:recombinase family protein n=1 Tax=Streptomyces lasiicapitis TaxID=1923961 RepID=UPI00364D368A
MSTKAQQHPDPESVADVVIYAYVDGLLPSKRDELIRQAHDYAAEQGWQVLDEITDDCAPSTARRLRPGWRRLANLVAEQDRQVGGIVCPREECLTDDPGDRSVIRAWAQVHGVFLQFVHHPGNGIPHRTFSTGDKGVPMESTPRPHPQVDVDFTVVLDRAYRTQLHAADLEGENLDDAVDQLLTDLSALMNEVITHSRVDSLRTQIAGAHDVIAQARKIGVDTDFDETAYVERLSWWTRYLACHLKLLLDDEAFR